MSANVEWDVPMTLLSPYATLDLNTVLPLVGNDAPFYMVQPPYQIVPAKFRPVSDSISQADGSSLQPPYIDGLVATLSVKYYVATRGDPAAKEPACAEDLRLMHQTLMGVLNSLRAYTADPQAQQRYLWTPTGLGDRRMLTDVLLASWPTVAYDGKEVTVTFSLGTPFPYAVDATEIDTVIADGTYVGVTNNGNAADSPVIEVAGATSVFTIENMETGEIVAYNGSTIPGGHFAEIDFFKGTIFLDGSGADLIDGFDPNITDFWLLAPNTTTMVHVVGANITVKSSNSWV